MKRLVFICFSLCFILLAAVCETETNNMNKEASKTAAAEVSGSTETSWEPYYTGDDEVHWEGDGEPWDLSTDNTYHAETQSQLMKEYVRLTVRGGKEPGYEDYAGSYINKSGSLTILLVSPTLERAEYYGKLCKTGLDSERNSVFLI